VAELPPRRRRRVRAEEIRIMVVDATCGRFNLPA
jgi:hypothetical protein